MKFEYFKRENNSGITLIETLVYLALLGMIISVIIGVVFSVGESNRKARMYSIIEENAILISEHLKDSINNSNSIDNNTLYGIESGVLVLTNDSGIISYDISDRKLKFNDGDQINDLTVTGINVSIFSITKIVDRNGDTAGVKIHLSLYYDKEPEIYREFDTSYILNKY